MVANFTPYSTGRGLFGQKPNHVSDELDQERLQSYELYEQIYWNVPEVFRLSSRGTNNLPIYVPSGRTIIDTSNRYTANGFALNITPRTGEVETPDVQAARMAMNDFMKRERFMAKFLGAKRYCQIQGDWIWHLTADADKPLGTRLSLVSIDPSAYFPVRDPENVERIVAVFLIETVTKEQDTFVRRLCYRKTVNGETSTITVEEGLFKLDQWNDLEAVPQEMLRPPTALPPEITAIPVYHTKNFEEPGNPFGSSEIRGMETLMAALNQTMSDEELTLALEGIGQYVTDAPQPVRGGTGPDAKTPVPWQLGPGSVIHTPEGTKFGRVDGVGSVTPYGDHFNRLWESLKWATASPDIAIGNVDVKVAESGIALALQMAPIMAKSGEKEELITTTHDQMFYDILNMWYPAYEETTFTEVSVECITGEKLPVDRAARFTELNDMLDKGVIDSEYYRTEAAKLGYVFPSDMQARVDAELAKKDEFRARVTTELDDDSAEA